MNRRQAISTGFAGFAAAVGVPTAARAQESAAENPELDPVRALLAAHDQAFANQDIDAVMACFSDKAALMGIGPGEIWAGPDEIKAAHQRFFEGFDDGEQNFDYEFSVGGVKSDIAWMLTSGNVTGKKDGIDFTFPVNISVAAVKDGEKWLFTIMHFSTLTDQNTDAQ